MQENGLRIALRERNLAVGQMIREFCTRGLPKILEAGGLDYMMIDFEHGGFGMDKLSEMAAYFKATPVAPFVRIPMEWCDLVGPILDQGMLGIQVSGIQTAADARVVVSHAKYRPMGDRGISMSGAHTDFLSFSQAEYVPWANANVLVVAAVETPEGIENVDEIAGVDGVDIVSIGHSDLTARMGIHMQLDHPRFLEALRKTVEACKRHGKEARIYPQNLEQLKRYYEMGFRVVMLPQLDVTLYRDALKASVAGFHECVAAARQAAGAPA